MRYLCKLDEEIFICEPEEADYNPSHFIGTISAADKCLYLTHNNLITEWS